MSFDRSGRRAATLHQMTVALNRTTRPDYANALHNRRHNQTRSQTMTAPISVRLDDAVRAELEAEAKTRGIGLATYLRQLASEAARDVRRKRIRAQSEAVGRYIAENPEAREFVEFWGTPRSEGL